MSTIANPPSATPTSLSAWTYQPMSMSLQGKSHRCSCATPAENENGACAEWRRDCAQREGGKHWAGGPAEDHEDVRAREAEFQVDQGLPSATPGSSLPGHDGGGQMRSAVCALARWSTCAIVGHGIVDRLSQRWGLAPGAAEGDGSTAVDEVDGGGEPTVGALHGPHQIVA